VHFCDVLYYCCDLWTSKNKDKYEHEHKQKKKEIKLVCLKCGSAFGDDYKKKHEVVIWLNMAGEKLKWNI